MTLHPNHTEAKSSVTVTELPGSPLKVWVSRVSEPRILVLDGELDLSNASRLAEETLEGIDDLIGDLVLDLEGLSFVDSSGLALFMALHKKLQSTGASLILAAPRPQTLRVLQITGLDAVLTIRPAPEA